MGWTSYHIDKTMNKNGKWIYDRKGELDKIFSWSQENKNHKVLKSSMVGSVYYAAVEITEFGKERKVVAVIVLTSLDNRDYCNFGYKAMDETMLPYYYDCPISILKLLTETDNENSNKWRKYCYEKIEKKKNGNSLNKLPVGTIIEFQRYNASSNAYETIKAIKRNPAYQFKTDWWQSYGQNTYIQKKHIPDNFNVISA